MAHKNFRDCIFGEQSSIVNMILDMKHFIFLTNEGFTQTPDNRDIENMQVLGFASGCSGRKAFKNLKKGSSYLLDTSFNNVIAKELDSEKEFHFSLK